METFSILILDSDGTTALLRASFAALPVFMCCVLTALCSNCFLISPSIPPVSPGLLRNVLISLFRGDFSEIGLVLVSNLIPLLIDSMHG